MGAGTKLEFIWLTLALITGLALVVYALFGLRLLPPEQDPLLSPLVPIVFELDAQEKLAQPVVVPEEPVVLYPVKPRLGDKIGTISLPSILLSWPVYEGTTEEQLSLGVGHFQGSVLPGIRDNSVLSGHRNTVFGKLGELKVGDFVVVGTSAGTFTYQVRDFRIVDKTSRDVIVPTETAILTLTTCYPFISPVKTTQAFIVTADLVASQPATEP